MNTTETANRVMTNQQAHAVLDWLKTHPTDFSGEDFRFPNAELQKDWEQNAAADLWERYMNPSNTSNWLQEDVESAFDSDVTYLEYTWADIDPVAKEFEAASWDFDVEVFMLPRGESQGVFTLQEVSQAVRRRIWERVNAVVLEQVAEGTKAVCGFDVCDGDFVTKM